MMPAMSDNPMRRSRAPGGRPVPPRRPGRRRRLAATVLAVFAAGIGLGALLGTWFARTELPSAQVALESREPAYELPTRAYRPPVRNFRESEPEPAPLRPDPPVATPQPVESPAAPAPVPEAPKIATAPRPKPPPEAETKPTPPQTAARPPRPASRPPVSARGTPKWLANAAAAPAANGRPIIAIVIDDLGLSQARVRRTIALPRPITLAFLPYGRNLRALTREGRTAGHELIIHMNMEPKDHGVDPGPKALLTSLDPAAIRERLEWALEQFDGYIGVSNHMGSRFTEWPDGMEVVVQTLKRRGLVYLDSVTSTKTVGPALARALGTAYASRDIFLDHDRSAEAVARQLAQTERIARRRGAVVAIGHPYDVTIDALKKWMPAAEARGLVFVPLSAIVRRKQGEG